MKSIRKSLTRILSIAVSLLVVSVLLITDLTVDDWIENQFYQSMKEKVGLLETLVNEDIDGVEFEFAGEYLPEFEGTENPQYFQLWYNGNVFEKSDTLFIYKIRELPYRETAVDTIQFEDLTLPDGRLGRVAYVSFIPQIDSVDRDAYFRAYGDAPRKTMTIAYATSIEYLQHTLWLIDSSFILALFMVPLLVRFTVKKTVSFALKPLDELNTQIRTIKLNKKELTLMMSSPVEELTPVLDSLNHFIIENSRLYQQQKRLTSDIAHELKTPVTELITLSEIAIKFPGEDDFEKGFKPEVFSIARRMKNIISSLLAIHKYSYEQLNCDESVNVKTMLDDYIHSLSETRIRLLYEDNIDFEVLSNEAALESVFINLINNALQHSQPHSTIICSIEKFNKQKIQIIFSNIIALPIEEKDLNRLFDPLWQLDPARTSTENFGLGLSIVKVLLRAVNGEIDVRLNDNLITFSVKLNSDKNLAQM